MTQAAMAAALAARSRLPALVVSILACASWTVAGPAWAAGCDDAAHRAFDFWVGEWEVRTPDGALAGTNVIRLDHGGCVLRERYETGRGYSGESLNAYDGSRGVWHQTWVDSSGLVLLLEGGLRDGRMVLEGRTVAADGKETRHRISWTPNEDGSVSQHWESSDADGGWRTAFLGRYTRK